MTTARARSPFGGRAPAAPRESPSLTHRLWRRGRERRAGKNVASGFLTKGSGFLMAGWNNAWPHLRAGGGGAQGRGRRTTQRGLQGILKGVGASGADRGLLGKRDPRLAPITGRDHQQAGTAWPQGPCGGRPPQGQCYPDFPP